MADRTSLVIREAIRQGLLGPEQPLAGFLDLDGLRRTVTDLHDAFAGPAPVLHAFAVKAASLVPVLVLLAQWGMGCEVAGPGELELAVAAGVPPERIVLDSPAKTAAELLRAVRLGVAVNADNLQELGRIDRLRGLGATSSTFGLRINPQVGAGAITAMSTATDTSKFGVALRDPGARETVLRACLERPWLTRLHVHAGSQGVPLELIAAAVRAVYELAEEINDKAGRMRIGSLDIGGGLPVNFVDDEVRPTFRDHVAALRRGVPGLLDGRYALVTEFGRAVLAKNGFIVAAVEYTKEAGGRRIAVTHAGAQVATRTVFRPDAWPLRVGAFDRQGRPKGEPVVAQDVAGPCCFAGDLVATRRPLPLLEPGDYVALYDTGAYYFSTPFGYNSLPRPAVHGFRTDPDPAGADAAPRAAAVRFATVRARQSLHEVAVESGLAQRDALRRLGAGLPVTRPQRRNQP
ncbi:diaminopimelate decarboxylase [Kitasatospora sp. NPDC052896]|uniref:diaminopimelate decarboxylase n=1 Tax=Kitasatospora sp. NPDC052896 TaxID=3364061 RepID=UPI0037C989E4